MIRATSHRLSALPKVLLAAGTNIISQHFILLLAVAAATDLTS